MLSIIRIFSQILPDLNYLEKAKVVLEKTGQPMLTAQAGSPDVIVMMLQSCGSSLFNEDGTANIAGNEELKKCMDIYAQMVKDGTLVEVTDWISMFHEWP